MKQIIISVGILAGLLFAGTAQATLHDRGRGLIYDDVLNITWVRDAALCVTLNNCVNRYDDLAFGGMRWNDANTWATNLVFGGYNDWRLPWASVSAQVGPVGDVGLVNCATATELACRDNEMGYMYYYNFGNLGTVDFYNIQGEGWSGTEHDVNGEVAWGFSFNNGINDQAFGDRYGMFAWAVRDGDVTVLLPVSLDIAPGSCPNVLNTKSGGSLRVAVVGTHEFDAATVDPASVRLVGVAPSRSMLRDVATPFEPFVGKDDAFDCTLQGKDGHLDLALTFDGQEVVQAIEEALERVLVDGEVLVLPLTANLLEEFGGTPIAGEDVVVIQKNGNH